jgi:hypothetical protein
VHDAYKEGSADACFHFCHTFHAIAASATHVKAVFTIYICLPHRLWQSEYF